MEVGGGVVMNCLFGKVQIKDVKILIKNSL